MSIPLSEGLYPHPFSRSYWHDASREFRNTRTLIIAAVTVALRVLSKLLVIRIGTLEWPIVGLMVNALGAMAFGPVVAVPVGFLSDLLGFVLFPVKGGWYFPPAAIPEILSTVVFALFLYRARVNVWRCLIARFIICFVVNVLISTPITMWYYSISNTAYTWLNIPRFIKNIITFPLDAVILTFFFRYAVPPLHRQRFIRSEVDALKLTRSFGVTLAALTAVGVGITFGYYVYDYNTTSLSASYTPWQRTANNLVLREIALENDGSLPPEDTVAVIERAMPTFGSPDITYTVAVYTLDREALAARVYKDGEHKGEPMNERVIDVHGYSKSPAGRAAKDGVLTYRYSLTVVTGSGTAVKSVERVPEKQ